MSQSEPCELEKKAVEPHSSGSTLDAKDPNSLTRSEQLTGTVPNEKAGRNVNETRTYSLSKESLAATPPVTIRTRKQRGVSHLQFGALCWTLFVTGWNDGTTGPLIPRMMEVYNVGYAVVSLVFVMSCIGFIGGALLNVWLSDKLGFGKVIVIGATAQIIAYSVQAPQPPFPVFIIFNVINGAGLALQDAQSNGFVGSLKENAETKMGLLHAAYGLGALSSPLVATQFSQMTCWSFHYLVSLGLAASNIALLVGTFRFKEQIECLLEAGEPVDETPQEDEGNKFNQILTSKAVQFLAFFILVYVGVEVTIGGWIVTYIIEVRSGGPESGYVSSGFFGGLTLGRVILLPINKLVGERRVLFVYAALALGLDFVIWFVPSLIGNAVTVSIIGLLLGPMYPIAMNHTARVLPPSILTGSIGWIAGLGQAGSALIPFMTGAIAEKHGIKSLHPLLVAMMALMSFLFWLVPAERSVSREGSKAPTISEKNGVVPVSASPAVA